MVRGASGQSPARVGVTETSGATARLAGRRSPAAHFATTDSLSAYWRFYWTVAGVQLARWLPRERTRILDLSGPEFRGSPRAVAAGHDVVQLLPSVDSVPPTELALVNGHVPPERERPRGRRGCVVTDAMFLSGIADAAFDRVLADNRVLSRHLMTEALLGEIVRVLRPGGRVLLCVDSVVLGMALLAEQDRWPELKFAPNSDVLLVPWPNGTITRCFTVEQLGELLAEAGLELEWTRPRTVLAASTVETMMANDSRALNRLVEMELKASDDEDYAGVHLLASARKPG